MKTTKLIALLCCMAMQSTLIAQTDKADLAIKLNISPSPVQNKLTVSNINSDEFDHAVIFNMQGAKLQQQAIYISKVEMDITNLNDGIYLLILRSSQTLKEKSLKFVVRK